MYTLKKEGRLRVVYCSFGTQKSKKQLLPLGKNVDFRKAARVMEILLKQIPMIATRPPTIMVQWKITLKERKVLP